MNKSLVAGCGVVVEWFELFGGYTDPAIVPEMERDRVEFAAQPGFFRKLLVVGNNPDGGERAGGIYFLRDPDSARDFLHWSSEVHRDPDGLLFEEREYVGEAHGYVGELIGNAGEHYTDPLPGAVRVQRFVVDGVSKADLMQRWARAPRLGKVPGLLGISLVHDAETNSAFVISVSGIRCSGPELDRASLDNLLQADTGAQIMGESHAALKDDLLFWVHTVWEGYEHGEEPPAATWPNSPPLPHAHSWKG